MCFLDLLGDAQSTSSAPCSVSQIQGQDKSVLYMNTMITEHSAGAAQVTECFHLTVDFEGNVPKYCFTASSESNTQTVETKVGMEGW